MKFNYKQGLLLVTAMAAVVLAQNCGKEVSFESSGTQAPATKLDSGELVPAPSSPELPEEEGNGPETPSSPSEPSSPSSPQPTGQQPQPTGQTPAPEEPAPPVVVPENPGGGKKPIRPQPPVPAPSGAPVSNSNAERFGYVCILAGYGSSMKLSLQDSNLASDRSTPATVCLSKSACENLVPSKFNVKRAERRGYCNGHNPHVVHLKDSEIAVLLEKLP